MKYFTDEFRRNLEERRREKERSAFEIFKVGFSGGPMIADNIPLYSTKHPIKRRWYHRFTFWKAYDFSDGTYKEKWSFRIKKRPTPLFDVKKFVVRVLDRYSEDIRLMAKDD